MRAGRARPGKQPGEDVCLRHPRQSLRLRIEGDLLIRPYQAHKALRHPSGVQMRQEGIQDLLIGLQSLALPHIVWKTPVLDKGVLYALSVAEPPCLLSCCTQG